MTPLEDLIQLLKARGVEPTIAPNGNYVKWPANEAAFMAFEHDGALGVTQLDTVTLSPEEAVAATLGPWTCRADETATIETVTDTIGDYGRHVTVHEMECSKCGHTYEHVNGDYEYCPRCGRRIEVDE